MLLARDHFDDTHLLSLVSSVGQRDNVGVYQRTSESVESLQDIQRFLREDASPERNVARQLVTWNFVSKDLLPLVKRYSKDRDLIMHVLKLLVFLSLPSGEETREHAARSRRSHQTIVADVILSDSAATNILLAALCDVLERLEPGTSKLGHDDLKTVELVLTLVRNIVLAVFQSHTATSSNHTTLESFLLKWLFHCSIDDLLVIISQDAVKPSLGECHLLVLEIVRCLCVSKTAADILLRAGMSVSQVEHENAIAASEPTKIWPLAPANTLKTTRFPGNYQHRTMGNKRVRAMVFRNLPGELPMAARMTNHACWSTEHTQLERFLERFMLGPLPSLLECVFKSLQNAPDVTVYQEEMIRASNFFEVLSYFMEISDSPKYCLDGVRRGDVVFSKILSTSFLSYVSSTCEKLSDANNTHGLFTLDRFVHVFTGFLRKRIDSSHFQIRSACHLLAAKIFCSKNERSLLQHVLSRLKSSDAREAHFSQLALFFENSHRMIILLRKLKNQSSTYDSTKLRIDEQLLKMMCKCIQHLDATTESTARALLFHFQAIVTAEPESLAHTGFMAVCALLIFKERSQNLSDTQEKLLHFCTSEVHQLVKRLRHRESKASMFVNSLFVVNSSISV